MEALGRYIDPFTDFGFKMLFGSEPHKDLLIDFLNELLRGQKKITQLTYAKNEHLGQTDEDRKAIFDLYCNKTEEELVTHFDKWLFLLKNLHRFQEIPAVLQEKIFRKVFKIAEVSKLNKQDMEQYQASLKYKRDWKNALDYATEEAAEEGMKRGMEKGMEKVAEGMKNKGYALSEIAELTGLSTERIQQL